MRKDFGPAGQRLGEILSEIDPAGDTTEKEKEMALDVIELLQWRNPSEKRELTERAARIGREKGMDIRQIVAAFLHLLAKKLEDSIEHLVARIRELGSILDLLPAAS